MEFTSLRFIIFVPFIIIAYYIFPGKTKPLFLLLISYLFCCSFMPGVLIPLCVITIATYLLGRILNTSRYRKLILAAGIIGVVVLMQFARMGHALLPMIGMSFYALQAISYMVDVYRGTLMPEKNLVYYALYIAFFPKFLSGPIERGGKFLPQITEQTKVPDYQTLRNASFLILWGYFEKLVVANHALIIVDKIFAEHWAHHGGILAAGAVLYAIQLYADFDGYSNIALGIAGLFGFHLTRNFQRPYFAKSIGEFWHRWHISLSSWLRDYIYIPLGGNRKGKIVQYLNLLITFGVSGIWHGAGMKYLVWGMMHGFYQVMGKILKPSRDRIKAAFHIKEENRIVRILQSIMVFGMVDFAWIFFRADSFSEALRYIYYMIMNFMPNPTVNTNIMGLGIDLSILVTMMIGIVILFVGDTLCENCESVILALGKRNIVVRWGAYICVLSLIGCAVLQSYGMDISGFLYAEF